MRDVIWKCLHNLKLQGPVSRQGTAKKRFLSFNLNLNHILSERLHLPVNDTLFLVSGGLRKTLGTGRSSIPGTHTGKQIFILSSSPLRSPRLRGYKAQKCMLVNQQKRSNETNTTVESWKNLKCDKCVYRTERKRGKSESCWERSFTWRTEGIFHINKSEDWAQTPSSLTTIPPE